MEQRVCGINLPTNNTVFLVLLAVTFWVFMVMWKMQSLLVLTGVWFIYCCYENFSETISHYHCCIS
jgi:hypothetical protein